MCFWVAFYACLLNTLSWREELAGLDVIDCKSLIQAILATISSILFQLITELSVIGFSFRLNSFHTIVLNNDNVLAIIWLLWSYSNETWKCSYEYELWILLLIHTAEKFIHRIVITLNSSPFITSDRKWMNYNYDYHPISIIWWKYHYYQQFSWMFDSMQISLVNDPIIAQYRIYVEIAHLVHS